MTVGCKCRGFNRNSLTGALHIPPIIEFNHQGTAPHGKRGRQIVVGIDEKKIAGRLVAPLQPGIEVHIPDLLVILYIRGKEQSIRHGHVDLWPYQPKSSVSPGPGQGEIIV